MKNFILSVFIFMTYNLQGQSVASYNLSPAGNSSMNNSGGLYFSIGEPMNTEIGTGDIMIAQGFLQVAIQGNLSDTYELLLSTAKVYPNPVAESLSLELKKEHGDHHYVLYNVRGEKLESDTIKEKLNKIDFANLNSGTYFLQIYTDDQSVGVYTIIKQ